ncbi:MAG: hypothetical protein LBS14_01700 [Holosporaceae bacterium]|jgi:hypothetical protein|nr:hypothetical protein [Holosporaceae bacterium]
MKQRYFFFAAGLIVAPLCLGMMIDPEADQVKDVTISSLRSDEFEGNREDILRFLAKGGGTKIAYEGKRRTADGFWDWDSPTTTELWKLADEKQIYVLRSKPENWGTKEHVQERFLRYYDYSRRWGELNDRDAMAGDEKHFKEILKILENRKESYPAEAGILWSTTGKDLVPTAASIFTFVAKAVYDWSLSCADDYEKATR